MKKEVDKIYREIKKDVVTDIYNYHEQIFQIAIWIESKFLKKKPTDLQTDSVTISFKNLQKIKRIEWLKGAIQNLSVVEYVELNLKLNLEIELEQLQEQLQEELNA